MKHIILLAFFQLSFYFVFTQNNIGIGTITPNPKALLDLNANDKGFLIPRLTTLERIAINPNGNIDASLLVYDSDDNLFYFWNSSQWIPFPESGNNLSLAFDTNTGVLSLTDAGGILTTNIPPDNDADPTNEIQQLTLNGNTINLSISNNNIDLIPYLDNTDNQTLTLNGSNLSISNGNSVNLPLDNDSNPTNETNNAFVFANNTLSLTDAVGTLTADLTALANDWKLTGNAGTNAATNFIGTTDAIDWAIRTNNIERVRVLSNGNVGIRTTAASEALEIASAGQFSMRADAGSPLDPGDIIFKNFNGTEKARIWSVPNLQQGLFLSGDNTANAAMTIDAQKFVGIGTTTPNTKLQVINGDISTNRKFLALDGGGSSTGFFRSHPTQNFLELGSDNNTSQVFITNGIERMRINNDGNVRIATTGYPNQCGGTNAAEALSVKFSVMSGFSSFGNFNHDPLVNPAAPPTTWAGGVGSLILGMNRSAGTSNVDFWNSSDPNNGSAALTLSDRGFNWRNFRNNGGNCAEQLLMTLDGNGNLTLSQVTGAGGRVNAYGFNNISDARAKTNIQPYRENVIDKLSNLQTVSYQYKKLTYEPGSKLVFKNEGNAEKEIGFIAQQVYEVFPHLVNKPLNESKELWGLDYGKLTPLLVEAIKQQQQLIELQNERIKSLEQKVNALAK